jgi:hypothetical protein
MMRRRINCVRDLMNVWCLSGVGGIVLATAFAVTTAQASLSAGDEPVRPGIEGAWDVNVTIRDCGSGAAVAAVHAMNMFMQGGTLTETSNDLLRGASVGTWDRVSRRGYTAVFRFFTFNADGSFAGRNKISREIKLSADAKGFVATAVFDVLDVNDNVLVTGCATETARRLDD